MLRDNLPARMKEATQRRIIAKIFFQHLTISAKRSIFTITVAILVTNMLVKANCSQVIHKTKNNC